MAKIAKKRMWQERINRLLRYMKIKLIRIDDSPEKIAMGAAFGVFVGIFPTFGLGMIISIVGAAVAGWNKVAAALGNLIMNPITLPFFWTISVLTGALIFNKDSAQLFKDLQKIDIFSWEQISGNLQSSVLIYFIGTTVVSVVFGVISYFIVKDAVIRHREKVRLRRQKKAGSEETDQINPPI